MNVYNMNKLIVIVLLLIAGVPQLKAQKGGSNPANRIPCEELEDNPAFIKADTLPTQIGRQPETLEESLLALDRLLNPYQKRFLTCLSEEEARVTLHFGMGAWVRRAFGLWDASPLRYHFLEMGVLHPDDMSDIILLSYCRRLKGEPLAVQQQVDYFQRYWRAQGVNVDSLLRSARKQE